MIRRTLPVPFPKTALLIRSLADQVVRTGQPVDLTPVRPPEIPSLSLTLLVKNEWETMVESVESLMPLPTEIIIGIDKTTDDPISFAYREAFLTKGKDACRAFFDELMKQGRTADMSEVAHFIGVSKSSLEKRVAKYLSKGKPTQLAALQCLEMVGKGKIIEIDFNDHFSNARNVLVRECTGELCMFVDGHEILSDVNALMDGMVNAERELPGYSVFGIMIDMIDSPIREKNRQVRIWRNSPNVSFTRGVHNRLHFDGEGLDDKVYPTVDSAVLIHNRPGWLALFREPQRQRMVSEHMGGKEDSSSLYYDGLGYQRAREWDKAIECFEKYIAISPPGPETATVCWYLATCLREGKKDREASCQWLIKGLEKCPDAAFCHLGIAQHKLWLDDNDDDEATKKRLLIEALAHARFAETSVYPGGSIAVPTYCYTWDAKLTKAEVLRRMERYGEAAMALEEALQYEMDPSRASETESAMYEMRRLNIEMMNESLRLSKQNDKKYVFVVDPSKEYGLLPFQQAEEAGFKVTASEAFDHMRFFESDIVWIEGAIDVLSLVSNISKGDRRIIVRLHPNDIHNEQLCHVNWENIDECLASSDEVISLAASQWDWPIEITSRFKVVPVIGQSGVGSIEPSGTSILVNIRDGMDWTLPFIQELAIKLPKRTVNVIGSVTDESVYDRIVSACVKSGIQNLVLHGRLHPSEIETIMSKSGAYVTFTPLTDKLINDAIRNGLNVVTDTDSVGSVIDSITVPLQVERLCNGDMEVVKEEIRSALLG